MKGIFKILLLTFSCLLVGVGQPTKPNIISRCGLQVNSYSGNLYLSRTDLYIPARGLDLDFSCSYNSGETKYNFGYGWGWTHTFNILYEKIAFNICIKRWDGDRDTFIFSGGKYSPPVGCYDSLTQYASGRFRLRTMHGVQFYFDDSTHRKVTRIRDRNGNSITIAYASGYPTSIADANGRAIGLTWSDGKMTQLVDAISSPPRIISYQYNSGGDQISVTDPLGNITQYEYNSMKKLVRMVDPRSTSFLVTYDDSSAVNGIQTPLSNETFSYNRGSKITTHTLGTRATAYTFNYAGQIIDISGFCCGYHKQFEWDSVNNIKAMIDANGNRYEYTYNGRGQRLTAKDPANNIMTFTYEPVYNRVTSVQDRMGNTTSIIYDSKGNPVEIREPLGITKYITWNSYGVMTSFTSGRGNTTTYTTDDNSYISTAAHPIGSESFTNDAVGNNLTYTDANGNATTKTFDKLNHLLTTQNALSELTTYNFDPNGNGNRILYPNGNEVNIEYDALNEITSVTDDIGVVMSCSYDDAGNITSYSDGNGIATTYGYTDENLLASVTRAGITRTITHDGNGNVISSTDGNGIISTNTVDNLNRLRSVSKGGITFTIDYNPNGDAIRRTDGVANSMTYDYDEHDRLIRITFPNASTMQYTYDQDDNVITQTNNNGSVVTYLYNSNNQLTKRDLPGANDDLYTLDAGGRILTANNNNASITYAYNAANRMISETMNGFTTSYSHNIPARQRTITYPGGTVVQEVFDKRGRLLSLSGGGAVASFARDPGSRLSSATFFSGNIQSQFAYNNFNKVASLTHRRLLEADMLAGYNYSYDGAWNPVIEADNYDSAQSQLFGYNNLHILTSVLKGKLIGSVIPFPVDTFLYSYDNAYNRTSVSHDGLTTYTTNNLNQYTNSSSDGVLTYGLNGNLAHSNNFNGTYNPLRQLVEGSDSTGDYWEQNMYDAFGRRIKKITNTDTISYCYDGERIVAELDGGNNVIATYMYGSEWIDDVVAMIRNGSTCYYLKDALGSVVALADSSGNVVERYRYDPFGKPLVDDVLPSWCPGSIVKNGNFSDSATAGAMPSPGKTAHWTRAYGTPEVPTNMGCGDSAFIGMWGNECPTIGEAIQQTLSTPIVPGHTYSISFCGVWNKGTPTRIYPPKYVFRLSNVPLTGSKDPNGVVIGFSDPVTDTFWVSVTLPDWVATGTYSILTVSISNQSAANHGDSVTYSYIDRVCIRDITPRTTSRVGNRFMFTGREYDAEIGMYYYRSRHYSPDLGRFIQRDPYGVWFDMKNRGNGYTYVGNNPIRSFDPMGIATGEPVPGAEVFIEQEPGDKPIAAGSPEPEPNTPGALSWLNSLNAVPVVPVGLGNPWPASAQGSHPVDFVGASVGDPAIMKCTELQGTGTQAVRKIASKELWASPNDKRGESSGTGPYGNLESHLCVSSGPYSQSLSNLDDNGIIARDDGSGGANIFNLGGIKVAIRIPHPYASYSQSSPQSFSTVNSYGINEDGIK